MAEQVFKSPGVFSREIDQSFLGSQEPFGTPGGVVGTAVKGPAFVPVTLASFKDFIDTFGNIDGETFGPYAIKEFLRNAQAAVYVRTLGVGDGKQRETTATDSTDNNGRVNNAGFIVGGSGTVGTSFNHQRDVNRDGILDAPGRTYFLGALHSQSAGSTFLSDAGIQTLGNATAAPLIRGILFAASGTLLRLSGSAVTGGAVQQKDYHNITGTVSYSDLSFTLVVSGHLASTDYPRFVTASFDVTKNNYFGKVFNRSPFELRNHGYLLYESFDVSNVLVTVTGTSLVHSTGTAADVAFLYTSSVNYNAGTANIPNFENYEERFTTPVSPYVISQKFGGSPKDLFKVEALSDGAWANDRIKISIANVKRSTTDETDFGTFSLLIRQFDDTDDEPKILEQFNSLTLDINSPNYVARRVGDRKVSFDFDQLTDAQKLIVEGEYDNKSKFIRVVPSTELKLGSMNTTALPVGFRGIKHLLTSGSNILTQPALDQPAYSRSLGNVSQPPLPLRKDIATGTGTKREADKKLFWGVQFERPVNVNDLNKGNKVENIAAFTRYYGQEKLTAVKPVVTASDTFNNNKFSLENIQIYTGSTADVADQTRAHEWAYIRNGIVTTNTNGTRSFDITKDLNDNSNLAKFTFILQSGFDGLNIFDKEFVKLKDGAATKEGAISALQAKGPTVGSYRKAIDVITNPTNVDINLLAVPGMTEPLITDYALDKIEDRFDALYILDPVLLDSQKVVVTSSVQSVSTKETINNHAARGLNSNFGAAYYPDVTVLDTINNKLVNVPPSVVVMGAFAFNDKVAQPWFAAAGFNRGALDTVKSVRVQLNQNDRDKLQIDNINPIATFPGKGAVIFGQKTLQQTQSALDRVNVRRLLIEVRRAIKLVSNQILFEQNTAATLQRFKNLINPLLERIQSQAGIERFKLVLDETTTSQADRDNHIVRGKVLIQPTKTIEVIALDFVVSNAGAQF